MNDDSAVCERFLEETRDASPANLLIKFEAFSSTFAKHGFAEYESRVFQAGGYKWKMIMYPEGRESEKEGYHVSVQFAIAETDSLPVGWKVNAIFAFFVYNYHLDNYLCFRGKTRRFDAIAPKHGITKLITKKTLIDPSKGYLVDDCCVFGAEVFVIKNQMVSECLSLVKDTAPSFKREWKIPGFCKMGRGCHWNSEPFKVGNHEWQVAVHQKIEPSLLKAPSMSVFIECIDAPKFAPRRKVKAEVYLRIINKLNGTHDSFGFNHWFTSSCRSRGFPECLSIADMISKGYLVDDCCYLDVEMCVQAVVLDDAHNFFYKLLLMLLLLFCF